MSLRGGYQVGRDVQRADVVDIADDAERRDGLTVGPAELRIPFAGKEAWALGPDHRRQRKERRDGREERATHYLAPTRSFEAIAHSAITVK